MWQAPLRALGERWLEREAARLPQGREFELPREHLC